jgi:hypothetical protein
VFKPEVHYQGHMSLDVHGKIYKIEEVKQITERFRKREFVVEIEDGRYPQTVLFQITGDRCELLDDFNIDDEVNISFNLRGREWTSPKGDVKFFNSLDVWKMERRGDQADVSSGDSHSSGSHSVDSPSSAAPDDGPPLPTEQPGWLEKDIPF